MAPSPENAAPPPHGRRPWRTALAALLLAGAALAAALALWLGALVASTPDIETLQRVQQSRASVILSADGETIGRFANAFETPVALRDVAPAVVDALIATEDRRFYEHGGLDLRRIVASAWATLRGDTQGGSTLTQQLARNLFPDRIGREQTLTRKLREAITALRIERTSTKPQILEAYLNTAPFLYNVRGIEMAARVYFDRRAAELDAAEAATLVGMLKGSYRYNPVRHPERALERRNLVLAQMLRAGALTAPQHDLLRAKPLGLRFRKPEDGEDGLARHFVAEVRERAIEWADARDIDLDRDGLTIRTTLDLRLQRIAQRAVTEQLDVLQRIAGREWSERTLRSVRVNQPPAARPFAWFWRQNAALRDEMARGSEPYRQARAAGRDDAAALAAVLADAPLMQQLADEKTRLTAGFVAIEPGSGAVRAWIGSPDWQREQFDHVDRARRQPGSTFKPFAYGAALQRGISSERQFFDEAIEYTAPDGSPWRPTDGAEPTLVPMTLREALAASKNTITAQLVMELGAGPVVDFARAAGVRSSPLEAVPSIALGTSPVTLLEMAGAYATLASLGEQRAPQVIARIEDRDGRLLQDFAPPMERTIERDVVERLVDMMRGVVNAGTATAIRTEWGLAGDLAGKTGTTQDNTDGWFLLMRPGLVAGAWVGFNDPRVRIRSDHWGQGGRNALRLVGDFFREAGRSKLVDEKARFPEVKRPPPEPIDAGIVPAAAALLPREPLYVGGN